MSNAINQDFQFHMEIMKRGDDHLQLTFYRIV